MSLRSFKYMRYWSFYFILLFLISCKGEFASPEIKESYDSVMYVHDEVMPEMSTINKLRRKLKKLPNQDNHTSELIQKLELADDGMMDWMKDFKLNKDASVSNQLDYLSKEQERIDKVSADMKLAITNAQSYLKQ